MPKRVTDISKRAILDALLANIEAQIEARTRSAKETSAGLSHEETRQENDKDTRAIEASYLARGQALRVEELQDAAVKLRFMDLRTFDADTPIDVSALVLVSIDDTSFWFFLALEGGGMAVEVEGISIRVITPASPVGRALRGRYKGESFELRIGARAQEYVVDQVT